MISDKTLVVLQPTPFCNIDCSYCYLPDRLNTNRMSNEVLTASFRQVLSSDLLSNNPIVFLWHLGEPLAAPISYYENAFQLLETINLEYKREYHHNFQTNGLLINNEWIDFFYEHKIQIGLSLDGPDFIHNLRRVNRSGSGTHKKLMSVINLMQTRNFDFSVIMVVTRDSLEYPNEICDFFLDNNISDVGFNIDEVEGTNAVSSFEEVGSVDRYKSFFRILLSNSLKSNGKLRFREITNNIANIFSNKSGVKNTTNQPLRIINITYEGNFSTFCPELVSAHENGKSKFTMGNILVDNIDNIYSNSVFKQTNEKIQEGVKKCRDSCNYWQFCGGGSPSNKYFENNTFDSTETITCKLHVKSTIDVLMEFVEENYQIKV